MLKEINWLAVLITILIIVFIAIIFIFCPILLLGFIIIGFLFYIIYVSVDGVLKGL